VPKNRPKKSRNSNPSQGRLREEQRIEKVLRELEADYERLRNERAGSTASPGARIAVFRSRLTPNGALVAVVRMSKADIKNGETVMTQLNAILAYVARRRPELGYIVAVTECRCGVVVARARPRHPAGRPTSPAGSPR
jgi:hypothetical protein